MDILAIGTPHRFCLLNQPALLWAFALGNVAVAIAYIRIPIAMLRSRRQIAALGNEAQSLARGFWSFILACAATHLLEAVTLFFPWYRLSAMMLFCCAVISVSVSIDAPRILNKILKNAPADRPQ
jgi:hypothetical protein